MGGKNNCQGICRESNGIKLGNKYVNIIQSMDIFFGLILVTALSCIGLIYWDGTIALKTPLYLVAGYGTFLLISRIGERVLRWLNRILKK